MKLRTRLILAFTYILATIIVALTIPLAVNLSARAEAEFETDTLIVAQTLAAQIRGEHLTGGDTPSVRGTINAALTEELRDTIERIVVVSAPDGAVVWDSDAEEPIGSVFANPQRPEVVAALDPAIGASAEVRFSEEEGRDIMVAAAPVIDDGITGAVRLTRRTDDVRESVRGTVIGIVVIGAAGLLAGIVIAFGLAGSLARPIQTLAAAAVRFGRGDLRARVGDQARGPREIEDLAGSFDEMADRVERTVRAQREFVANASHQLRTPLTGMKLQLENALTETTDPELRTRIEAAEHEVDRLAAIVDRLLATSRQIEEGAEAHADLADVVRRAVDRWHERAERAGTPVGAPTTPTTTPTAIVLADPTDVDQILDNLIENALAHGSGPVEVTVGSDTEESWVSVRDHGPGIPADERAKVTERFFRGQGSSSKGSGLGLAIAQELADRWGGSLRIDVPDGGGTCVAVRFRRATVEAAT
jgi:signal transduction histidine kinase